MRKIQLPAEKTADLIRETLERRFAGVLFAVRLDDPPPAWDYFSTESLRGLDVIWVSGPSRETVEQVLEPFQGREWNPHTGALEEAAHYQVNEAGEMVRVEYGIDYIFCDGPAVVRF